MYWVVLGDCISYFCCQAVTLKRKISDLLQLNKKVCNDRMNERVSLRKFRKDLFHADINRFYTFTENLTCSVPKLSNSLGKMDHVIRGSVVLSDVIGLVIKSKNDESLSNKRMPTVNKIFGILL